MANLGAITPKVPGNRELGGVYAVEVSGAADVGDYWTVTLPEFLDVVRVQWSTSAGVASPAVGRDTTVSATNVAAVASVAGATGDEMLSGRVYYSQGGSWYLHPQVTAAGTFTGRILVRRWRPEA